MNAPFGQNLESACTAYQRRRGIQIAAIKEEIAGKALALPVGSLERKTLESRFVGYQLEAKALGINHTK